MKSSKNKEITTANTSSKSQSNRNFKGGAFSKQEKKSDPFIKPRNTERYQKNNSQLVAGLPLGQAEEFIGGRTFGELVGDVARPVGTVLGNVVGGVAGALTGISISTSTVSGPTWSNHGAFNWQVGFSTTGRNGWIVQKIKNTYRAQNASGTALGGRVPTPEYWEAWAVDGSGNVTPNRGAVNDIWGRPSRGAGSQGHWSMKGNVYFTTTDPATKGLTRGGVPDAGSLLSSTTSPGGLGVARLHRYAQGTWQTTGTTPTHTGSAF